MRTILSYIIGTIGVIALGLPMVFWFKNPEFSEMQMLIKFWYAYLTGTLCLIFAFILLTDDELIF